MKIISYLAISILLILTGCITDSEEVYLLKQKIPNEITKNELKKFIHVEGYKLIQLRKHKGKRGELSSFCNYGIIKIGSNSLQLKENVSFGDFFEINKIQDNKIQDSFSYLLSEYRDGMLRLKFELYFSKKKSKLIAVIKNSNCKKGVIYFDLIK